MLTALKEALDIHVGPRQKPQMGVVGFVQQCQLSPWQNQAPEKLEKRLPQV